jgi:RimK family alpha-L-glutamate ligase
MRVAAIGEPTGWHVGRLIESLTARGHQATVVRWSEITAGLGPGTARGTACGSARDSFSPPALAMADVVLVRGMPGAAAPDDRLEEVVFRMDALGLMAARGTRVINSPRALESAIDKYLSLARLAAAGLPVPRTLVVQDVARVAEAWDALGGDCVMKPLFGSRGRGLHRLNDRAALSAWLDLPETRQRPQAVVYLQEFIHHGGWDARLFVLGSDVFAMRRWAKAGEWRTNIARGGRPEPFAAPQAWIDVALRAATTLETDIAGIDLVQSADGSPVILEVNAVPGWQALQAVTGIDIAAQVVGFLEAGQQLDFP